ncbi:L,D-transpeptidase family protein [Parablastomonas sp. CN1-191]|uniref:L,D-transpeptidase family protein n=1 Tax=Parablastomonas sp. CN1-191 TaxID=3400908 RepID=UPI003BF8C52B
MIKAAWILAGTALVGAAPAFAQAPAAPATKPAAAAGKPAPAVPTPAAVAQDTGSTTVSAPAPVAAAPVDEPTLNWTTKDAEALLATIKAIDAEGLLPADYQPKELADAILAGEGDALNAQASKSMSWLVEDMRDGRTRMDKRKGWFVVDPDVDANPTNKVMAAALAAHDVSAAIAALAPTHPDYAALKTALASAKPGKARDLIRVNMDRWRWLGRDLGKFYLITNVPEYQLRLTVNNSIIRSYRTIVGKPGKTATPSLAETVEGVIFNPTWTVPQSIVKGEGLGARLLGNPREAAREGYKATKNGDGSVTVVQQPGPRNSLGLLKLDMPNEHAIFIHDTPNRNLFNLETRALSHGCVRTERAQELGMTMAMLGAGMKPEEGVANATSGKYTKVPMTKTFPVYITYFTYATDVAGKMRAFGDIYDRDAPVLASFSAPRAPWDGQRKTTEAVVKLDNPI